MCIRDSFFPRAICYCAKDNRRTIEKKNVQLWRPRRLTCLRHVCQKGGVVPQCILFSNVDSTWYTLKGVTYHVEGLEWVHMVSKTAFFRTKNKSQGHPWQFMDLSGRNFHRNLFSRLDESTVFELLQDNFANLRQFRKITPRKNFFARKYIPCLPTSYT